MRSTSAYNDSPLRQVRTSLFMGDAPVPLSSDGAFWVQVPLRDGCACCPCHRAEAAAGAPQVEPTSPIRLVCFRLVANGSAQPRRLFLDSVTGELDPGHQSSADSHQHNPEPGLEIELLT